MRIPYPQCRSYNSKSSIDRPRDSDFGSLVNNVHMIWKNIANVKRYFYLRRFNIQDRETQRFPPFRRLGTIIGQHT